MKKFVVMTMAVAMFLAVFTVGAQARSSYYWPASEKFAFNDYWGNWATRQNYRWPWLYADCLQKSAQKMYPTYSAYLRDGSSRWLNSAAAQHCVAAYAIKWSDDYGY